MKLLKKKLEVVSLHIPKCGGTSFLEVLYCLYGRALQFDYNGADPIELADDTTITHGHLALQKYLGIGQDISYITWIRNPVERIVSYYNYWKSMPKHANPHHDYFIDNNLTLLEFCEYPPIRHELMEGYLAGFDWRRFRFVGILEHFARDINVLAKLFNWKKDINIPHRNEGGQKQELPSSIRSHIEQIHSMEMEFYHYWSAKNSQVA